MRKSQKSTELKGSKTIYYYDSNNPIGEGAYGTVYKGRSDKQLDVAIKEIKIDNDNDKKFIEKELLVLKKIKGAYVTGYIEYIDQGSKFYLILEYCDGGTLRGPLESGDKFNQEEVCTIVKQIAVAFLNIDQGSMMHRDLKPDNILCKDGHIKVADFGFAKIIDHYLGNQPEKHTADLGSPIYMSPQMLANESYSCKTDVWSTGITLYELIHGYTPWTAESKIELIEKIYNYPLNFEEEIESDLEDLIRRMLEINEADRLSWSDVYNHKALEYVELEVEDWEGKNV